MLSPYAPSEGSGALTKLGVVPETVEVDQAGAERVAVVRVGVETVEEV